METNIGLANFAGGEITPNAWGRYDRPFYLSSLEVCRNFIPKVTGPVKYRPGFEMSVQTRYNEPAVLIPFQFNDEQAYALEFTTGKMRILKDDGLILESTVNITGITQANPGVVTAAGHGYSNGDEVFIDSAGGMSEVNGQYYRTANVTANTFELQTVEGDNVDTTGYTAYTSGGTVARVYTIDSPYNISELYEVKYAQIADVMYMAHPNYEPYKLIRAGETSWTLATYTRINDPFTGAGDYPAAVGFFGGRLWFGGTNNAPDSIWGSRGPNATTGAPQYDDFTTGTAANDSVRYTITSQNNTAERVRWFAGNPKFLAIGTYGGVLRANGGSDGQAITPTAISVTPADSFGCKNIMPILTGGQVGYVERGGLKLRSFEYSFFRDSYESFDKTVLADEIAVAQTDDESGLLQLAYTQGTPNIIWSVRNDGLLLSTTFLSVEDVAAWARHPVGGDGKVLSICGVPRPNNVDRLWISVEREVDGRTVRTNEFLSDDPIDLDLLDFFTGEDNYDEDNEKFLKLQFERQREYVRLDSSLKYDGIQAAQLTLGATDKGTITTATAGSATFESDMIGRRIAVKFITGEEDGVAVITDYTSPTEVEVRIEQTFSGTVFAANTWYISAQRLGGFYHLKGATVGVVTDGGIHPDVVVDDDGFVDLEYPTFFAIIGFKYRGILRTLDLEFGAQFYVAQGREKTVNKMVLKFRKSLGMEYSTEERGIYTTKDIAYKQEGYSYYDRPAELFSGSKDVTALGGTDLEKRVTLVQDQASPCLLLSLIIFMDVNTET